MKIIATSDWHLGNLFHGNDRLPEHRHFLHWLEMQVSEQRPDALLVAGDVFDNGNPSAAAQEAYYDFLARVTQVCPEMHVIITAGNHDSASRLEAPRPLLSRHKVEIRGKVRRNYVVNDEGGQWEIDYEDMMIPMMGQDGREIVVLAVPYLRTDVLPVGSYSQGVNAMLRELTQRARAKYPDQPLVMMAHMYAKGADIAPKDASEKIVIGGQEEVTMDNWPEHPDYLTCGHIHKRQHIWSTNWARYTGSVLPMSFVEKDYRHGVDLVTIDDAGRFAVEQLVYEPQHKLMILPEEDEELTPAKLKKLINAKLEERVGDRPNEDFVYLVLKVKLDKVKNDDIKELEALIESKNAVLCKIQRITPQLNITTLSGNEKLSSIDDVVNRDPMETLKEAFFIFNKTEMNEQQAKMLQEIVDSIKNEEND